MTIEADEMPLASSRALRRGMRITLYVLLVDLALVVMTGGVSLIGPVSTIGFAARSFLALGLVAFEGFRRNERFYAYLALLLLLLPILHFRGFRLRGDGLWYYSYAHSVALDGDIDLLNQYRRLGIDHQSGSQPVRETGRGRFAFPVGAPLSWVPFIWLGHVSAWWSNVHGIDTAYDGFSDPYLHTVALGNLILGWLGLLVLDRFLRHWFEPAVAFLTTVGIGLGSFLGWYLTYHSIYTHALTFLLVALFLMLWNAGPKSLRDFAVMGLVLGAAGCVRWQNGVFGLLLAPIFLAQLSRRKLLPGIVFGAAAIATLLPQFVSWKIIFDKFYIGVPLGPDFMRWGDPFLTETLFSSRHGLFSWSPLLLLAVFGLPGFVRRHPRTGLPLAALLLLLTYVNSSVSDWWAGGSFGSRRFDSVLPILALGLATSLDVAIDLVKRYPRAVVATMIALVVAGNGLLMEQYRKGRVPPDGTISWEAAVEDGLEDIFDGVGYPFSFPMNWIFAARYDRPKTQYDILVGKYLFHSMLNLGGVIDLGPSDPAFIGNGWSGLKDWEELEREVRHAEGPRSGIFVPTDRAETLRIYIECSAPPGVEPAPVEVWLNGARVGGFFPSARMEEHALTVDAGYWRRINLLELVPAIPVEGTPFLAVDKLRFERVAP
ncbi:MAG: hypothetical protein E2P02_16795 [Acidobacteria bacterium]|nr:MAG: hypothetical protein E2P02_16795 [Acidobacteriota bacterium]